MIKKAITFFLALVLSFSFYTFTNAEVSGIEITAPSAVLIEEESGMILYEKNARERRSIASVTKIMTLLLTMEAIESGNLSLSDTLYTSEHAASMGGSDIWLEPGESMTVSDLIKAVVIMSANDASVVLAEAIAGSEESFVVMMNTKAQELGMLDTQFKNSNGLDEEGHYSTAYDVSLMSRQLIKHEEILNYTLTRIDYLRDGATQLVNTNKLINNFDGITGLKTGTTSTAGSCMAATATRNEISLITVVLGADSSDNRFNDAAAILNYGFANWTISTPIVELPESVLVKNGMKESVQISLSGDTRVLTEISKSSEISSEFTISEQITAPIQIGDVIGNVKVKVQETVYKEIPIVAAESCEEIDFFKIFINFLSRFKM